MSLPAKIQSLIKARKKAKWEREQKQRELIEPLELHKSAMEAKLIGLLPPREMNNFAACGREERFMVCSNCKKSTTYFYKCNKKWCPLCNRRLAYKRQQKIKVWARHITQPKHLVMTMRNFAVLTRSQIRRFQRALLKLRHRKIAGPIKGGCSSLEITNSGEGWHLHAHMLLDVRWLDMEALAIQWGKLLGQEFGIAKIKDARDTEYLEEICKYVAKSSEMAGWDGEELHQFIEAIRGVRMFSAFGSLRKMQEEIKRELLAEHPGPRMCECGCEKFWFDDEASSVIREIRQQTKGRNK